MLIDPKWSKLVAVYTGTAIAKITLFVLAFNVGNYLDNRLGTKPLFLIVLLLVAMGLGTWYVVIVSKRKL